VAAGLAAGMYFLILTVGNVIVTAALIGVLVAWFWAVRRELRR